MQIACVVGKKKNADSLFVKVFLLKALLLLTDYIKPCLIGTYRGSD